MPNALEIDFHPVGTSSKSGDAITFRIGDYKDGLWSNQKVFVIDGGNLESGEAVVTHITKVYNTTKVERAFLTHPDGDHASGLRTVLNNLEVGKIWMHRPWNHWTDLKGSLLDGRITKKSWGERLKAAYNYAYEVEQIAIAKKIPIYPAHQGAQYTIDGIPIITVLGPSKELYTSLLELSDKTPGTDLNEVRTFTKSTTTVREDMSFESENLADDEDETSRENDMSLILLLEVAGQRILFTGDAGTMALYKAINFSITKGIELKNLDLMQVPHHGSRHNLSKGILKYIHAKKGMVSCAADSQHHPSPVITNALLRRGIIPYTTKDSLKRYNINAGQRAGFSPSVPAPFTYIFELSDK